MKLSLKKIMVSKENLRKMNYNQRAGYAQYYANGCVWCTGTPRNTASHD